MNLIIKIIAVVLRNIASSFEQLANFVHSEGHFFIVANTTLKYEFETFSVIVAESWINDAGGEKTHAKKNSPTTYYFQI